MGIFDKFMNKETGNQQANKERITELVASFAPASYKSIATYKTVQHKKLTKTIREFFNYIVAYGTDENGEAELIIVSISPRLDEMGQVIHCKKSQCQSAVYSASTGEFSVSNPQLENGQVTFGVNTGTVGIAGYLIDVSYLNEFMDFSDFFSKHFSK